MQFRAPVPADAPAVVAVLAARDVADYGVRISRLEDLRHQWRGSDLDLDRDGRVVEDEHGQIVAYALVRRHGAFAVVAPEHEGRGIGSRLLKWAEARERDQGRELHRQWVAAANRSAGELLSAAGYHKARSYWRMVRALDAVHLAGAPPAGVRLRAIDPADDAAALHALDAISFAGAPDYEPESLQEFCEEHLSGHDFDAELSRVAEHAGAIVGFLIASRRVEEGVGYVDLLAVDPHHQRHGIATALLHDAFAAFAGAGLHEAQLMVASDNPSALRVYQRAGMTIQLQSDIYERPTGPVSSRWRAYRDVDAADDPDTFADELEDIASVPFVASEKRRSLELLELGRGGRVLDVGCGTGSELISLAQIVGPRGRVVGLDRSGSLIARARELRRDRGPQGTAAIALVEADAVALPFEGDEFDACRADRTLQHLDRPEAALTEMIRVVRPAGRVVVTESRWGLVAPSLEQALTDRVLGLLASGREQAEWVGYRLPEMCQRAGLLELRSLTTNYTASGRDEFFRFTQLRSAAKRAARAGTLSETQAHDWLAQLEALVARGEAFAMVLILHVAAVKPARDNERS